MRPPWAVAAVVFAHTYTAGTGGVVSFSRARGVNASPGDILHTVLTATKQSRQPLPTLLLSDATPAFPSDAGPVPCPPLASWC